MNTQELISRFPKLSQETKQLLSLAISTRGKWKGYVKASAPSVTKAPEANLAWQCLVSNLAPSRVSIGAVIIGDGSRFAEIDKEIVDSGFAACLRAIEPDFRWNLYAMRHDTDAERKALSLWLDKHGV